MIRKGSEVPVLPIHPPTHVLTYLNVHVAGFGVGPVNHHADFLGAFQLALCHHFFIEVDHGLDRVERLELFGVVELDPVVADGPPHLVVPCPDLFGVGVGG